jgi:hypothetical protein
MQADRDGTLTPGQRTEKEALQQPAGIRDDAPMRMVRAWADIGSDTMGRSQRCMTARQRQIETLGMRWGPRQPLTGRQAVVELLRLKGEWYLTKEQAELYRLRAEWV